MSRYLRFAMFPINFIWARLSPVSFAKKVGVNICGSVTIYGSSYEMFSAEPYLVTLGDNVFISIGVSFVCHDGSTLPFRRTIPDLEIAGKIKVGNNVFIGKGALILPNVEIGDNCIVGANSVVTKNIESNSVVGGNPAKVLKKTDEYLIKAQANSLKIGHLTGQEKVQAYKKIFSINH